MFFPWKFAKIMSKLVAKYHTGNKPELVYISQFVLVVLLVKIIQRLVSSLFSFPFLDAIARIPLCSIKLRATSE
jgi:hypothetical protein